MPFYEYLCEAEIESHVVEKFFKTFSAAASEEHESLCPDHGCIARRIMSAPLQAHLYGNPAGFNRPSPAKRFTYKTVSQKDGNKFSGA